MAAVTTTVPAARAARPRWRWRRRQRCAGQTEPTRSWMAPRLSQRQTRGTSAPRRWTTVFRWCGAVPARHRVTGLATGSTPSTTLHASHQLDNPHTRTTLPASHQLDNPHANTPHTRTTLPASHCHQLDNPHATTPTPWTPPWPTSLRQFPPTPERAAERAATGSCLSWLPRAWVAMA